MKNDWFNEVFLPSFGETCNGQFISEKQMYIFKRNLKFKEKSEIYGCDTYLQAEKDGKIISLRWNYQRCGRSKTKRIVYKISIERKA